MVCFKNDLSFEESWLLVSQRMLLSFKMLATGTLAGNLSSQAIKRSNGIKSGGCLMKVTCLEILKLVFSWNISQMT